MEDESLPREAGEVDFWNLVFFPGGQHWFGRFIAGRFKHVAAFGYSQACRTWVVYDMSLLGTRLYVVPGTEVGKTMFTNWAVGATIVKVPAVASSKRTRWLGLLCAPSLRHLTGLRGWSWLPSGLYRGLISRGGEIIHDPSALIAEQLRCRACAQPEA